MDRGAGALAERNRELSILNAIAEALAGAVDLDQALGTTLAQVAALLGLETGWVWLLREADGESYLAASQSLPPALADVPERMAGSCYCLDTFRAGDMAGAANINVVTCSRLKWLTGGTHGLRYHASIPLYAHGRRLGVLNVASRDWRELSGDDLRLLHTVGDMLGIAVERARLFERSAELGAAEERNRLAREIHDTLAQALAGIAFQLETADLLLEQDPGDAEARRSLRRALEQTRGALRDARRSVLNLRPTPLEGRGLIEALGDLAAAFPTAGGGHIRFEARGGDRALPAHVEVGLYRIAQEALANVNRHAGATRTLMRVRITDTEATLVVQDNGRGFDSPQRPPDTVGLLSMNERARLMGGQLRIESRPGRGTRLHVVVPLDDTSTHRGGGLS